MADHRAIRATCEAVVRLLHDNYQRDEFDDNQLDFQVYLPGNFSKPMTAGVSLFLYRVCSNGTNRIPGGRIRANGHRYETQLPLDLFFLLTAWGQDASMQHTIVGWMMRVMEDNPILPSGLLNVTDTVFRPDETVEIVMVELKNEEMFHIWRILPEQAKYQLSIPYIARNVRIESTQSLAVGQSVQERAFDYGKLGDVGSG